MSFWQTLKKPIIGLSPMDGVTDEPMRFIQKKYGQPAVEFSEFINVEHVPHKPEKLMERFIYSSLERPIVAQLSGHTPELFYQFAFVACYLGFDGIDINMGCPVKSVIAGGGGAALIENHSLAQEIVLAVKKAINDWQEGADLKAIIKDEKLVQAIIKTQEKNRALSGLKIGSNSEKKRSDGVIGLSVKTRMGTSKPVVEEWIGFLSSLPLDAIILHGRLLTQGQKGRVFWQEIAYGAIMAQRMNKIFLGNGGVKSAREGYVLSRRHHLDGVLIAQAALGNPWVFSSKIPSREEKLSVMIEQAEYFDKLFGKEAFVAMRKHFVWYCRGFKDAKRLKQILQKTKTLNQARAAARQ